jgi:hypothetical protein
MCILVAAAIAVGTAYLGRGRTGCWRDFSHAGKNGDVSTRKQSCLLQLSAPETCYGLGKAFPKYVFRQPCLLQPFESETYCDLGKAFSKFVFGQTWCMGK